MTPLVTEPGTRDQVLPSGIAADGLEEPVRAVLRRLPGRGADPAPPLRTLGVIGCPAGAGASTVAARLAAEAALTGREPVLLVDAHPARPAAHRLLEVRAAPGLAEVLRDGTPLAEVLQPCRVPRLYVLAAGRAGADPAAATDSPWLPDLLRMVREEFALAVFDLPPGDPAGLAGLLDGLVLVAEAERTPLEAARRETERLAGQTRLLGVVLNKRRQYTPQWLDRFL